MTVAVLGGGPAGLYAALLLARRRIPVVLVEREEIPGGLAAGRIVDGQPVDLGSHRLHPSIDPEILVDLESLLGSSLQVRRRNGRIRFGDRWLSFPLSPTELAGSLPVSVLARLGLGALAAMVRPSRDNTFADVVASGLGRPMGELFYFPYARKIWGVEPEALSGEQARRRIGADTPARLIRKALSAGSGRTFRYPTGGFGAIPSAIADAARAEGADLRLGSAVRQLSRTGDGWEIATGSGTLRATLVLSTLPIGPVLGMFHPPAPVDGLALPSRGMVLLYLTVRAPQWTEFDAHYFPGSDVPFTRISEPKNYRDAAGDPRDRSVICVEIPADPQDPIWMMDDDRLAATTRRAIVDLGLPDPGDRGTVVRLSSAYPVYRVGYRDALDRAQGWVDTLPGFVTFGRQGLFAHDNTHHALVMARDAVGCVGDDLTFDRRRWESALQRFASHVVED